MSSQPWWPPLGVTNGNATLIAERLAFVQANGVDTWFAGFYIVIPIYIIAILLFLYKQRSFPVVLIAALFGVAIVEPFREITRGSLIPWISEKYFWGPGVPECYTLYLWIMWVEAAEYVILVSLAIELYKSTTRTNVSYCSIVRSIWRIVAAFVVYPILYTSLIKVLISSEGFVHLAPSCAPASAWPSAVSIFHTILLVIVLAIIGGLALQTPRYSTEKEVSASRCQIFWRTIKIVGILSWLLEIRLGFSVYYLNLALEGKTEVGYWSGFIGVLVGHYLQVFFFLWFIVGLYVAFYKFSASKKTGDSGVSMKLLA